MKFSQLDSLYPGARYHNRKLLMSFPTLGRSELCWPALKPVPHPQLESGSKRKAVFKGVSLRLAVSVPKTVHDTNGKTTGKTVTWDLAPGKLKDHTIFLEYE